MNIHLDLFLTFSKIGACTFGGGYAMLPILQREIVENKQWATEDDLADYYPVGQCTPGIIAVNVATFVGFKKKGVLGAIFSTLGMISPSLIIISILALFLEQFISNKIVAHAVEGIKIVVCALMLNTLVTMAKKTLLGALCYGLAIGAFLLALFTPIPTVLLVIIAGLLGVILYKAGGLKL